MKLFALKRAHSTYRVHNNNSLGASTNARIRQTQCSIINQNHSCHKLRLFTVRFSLLRSLTRSFILFANFFPLLFLHLSLHTYNFGFEFHGLIKCIWTQYEYNSSCFYFSLYFTFPTNEAALVCNCFHFQSFVCLLVLLFSSLYLHVFQFQFSTLKPPSVPLYMPNS